MQHNLFFIEDKMWVFLPYFTPDSKYKFNHIQLYLTSRILDFQIFFKNLTFFFQTKQNEILFLSPITVLDQNKITLFNNIFFFLQRNWLFDPKNKKQLKPYFSIFSLNMPYYTIYV